MKEKKFSDFLAEVKKSDPSLTHREAQTKASEKYKAYKLALLHPKAKLKAPEDPGSGPKTDKVGPGPKASEKPQGERTFADFLKEVQEAAPSLSLRDAQKKASELYKAYRAETKVKASEGPGPEIPQGVKDIDIDRSATIEGAIRGKIPTTLNSIKGALNNANVTGYKIHEVGKTGVNTNIFATAPGIRVPVKGHFLVFIAR